MSEQKLTEDRALLAALLDRLNGAEARGGEKAEKLIGRFGSLRAVLEASPRQLEACGLSEGEAVLLSSLPAVARRRAVEPFRRGTGLAAGEEADLVRAMFTGVTTERTMLVALDERRRILLTAVLGEGTDASVNVDMRALIAAVLSVDCKEAILCHNHPGGTAAFSDADLKATRAISDALDALGIALDDHWLAAGREVVSMKGLGLMKFTKIP